MTRLRCLEWLAFALTGLLAAAMGACVRRPIPDPAAGARSDDESALDDAVTRVRHFRIECTFTGGEVPAVHRVVLTDDATVSVPDRNASAHASPADVLGALTLVVAMQRRGQLSPSVTNAPPDPTPGCVGCWRYSFHVTVDGAEATVNLSAADPRDWQTVGWVPNHRAERLWAILQRLESAATALQEAPVAEPVPVPPPPPPPPVAESTFTDAELAAGLPAAPLAGAWQMPAQHRAADGCWTRYTALSQRDRDATSAAFRARNGIAWDTVPLPDGQDGVDKFTGAVRGAATIGAARYTLAAITHLELARRARQFMRRNADFLGLVETDFAHLAWSVQDTGPGQLHWTTRATYLPAPEQEPAGRQRTIDVSVSATPDGQIGYLLARVHPGVGCSRPLLSPRQVRQLPGVLGARLRFGTQVGTVTSRDIVDVALVMARDEDDSTLEYRLEYQVLVLGPSRLRWSIWVDAATGKVLQTTEMFQS